MAAAQAAENHGDECDLTRHFLRGNIFYILYDIF